jgi:Mn2+/Fe2+ NRAMP family transporter
MEKKHYGKETSRRLDVMQTAVLDNSHVGEITGALGTIAHDDYAPRTNKWAKIVTYLAIMGPGLIVMFGDNDAGGVSTYTQAGQNYGTSLLWTALLLIPVLIVNQEMVVRLGTVTRVGHARLIFERFGKFWGAFSVGDLFILNFLTLVTEFIGVSLGMSFLGVSSFISVPVTALILIIMTAAGSFKSWERAMYSLIGFSFLIYPLVLMAHPHLGLVSHGLFIPGIKGGVTSTAILLIIGIVGTTVAPWQLFFQQSNIIDKRIGTRWIRYERWDTVIGALLAIGGAVTLMAITAFAFAHTKYAGNFTDSLGVANGLSHTIGYAAGVLFAIVLIVAGIIGAGAVTLSSAYAFGDAFKTRHSLHSKIHEAKTFYLTYMCLIAAAAAIVLIPHAPLGLMTLGVQVLAGILLPSATVFLVLLCNDKAVLGPWTNPKWLNAIAVTIVGVLVVLSLILATTTLFPSINTTALAIRLGLALIVCLLAMGLMQLLKKDSKKKVKKYTRASKLSWQMPPLDQLKKPEWSAPKKIGMYSLRGYLIIAAILLVVKIIKLASGH